MTFFGFVIVRRSTIGTLGELLAQAAKERDMWQAKYFYAKARALVAERFRNPTITVEPVRCCDHCGKMGVIVEVGIKPPEDFES